MATTEPLVPASADGVLWTVEVSSPADGDADVVIPADEIAKADIAAGEPVELVILSGSGGRKPKGRVAYKVLSFDGRELDILGKLVAKEKPGSFAVKVQERGVSSSSKTLLGIPAMP
jgi:hypothetical protein